MLQQKTVCRPQRDLRREVFRITVDAGADRRESNAAAIVLARQLEAPDKRSAQELRLPCPAPAPHRADGMEDVTGQKLTRVGGHRAPRRASLRIAGARLLHQDWSGCPMDRTVHSPTTGQFRVGGVDDGVDSLGRDVSLSQFQTGFADLHEHRLLPVTNRLVIFGELEPVFKRQRLSGSSRAVFDGVGNPGQIFANCQRSNRISLVIRLLLLIPTLDRSGAEKQLTLLATQLPRSEFDVHVVALTRGGPYADDLARAGVRLTILHKRFRFDPVALRKLKRLLRDQRPDVLHTWLFAGNAYGRLAAGPTPSCPVVVSERCVDVWKARWQLAVDRWLAPRTSRLIGNSQSVAEFYRQQGFPADRMAVIHNGVDLPDVDPHQRGVVRGALGISPQTRVIAYVGRLARQKRVQDLIWAFELVRVMEGDVLFLIAGDGPEREGLERFASNLGISERIRFLGHRADAQSLLPAADLFWLASDFEGLSNSIMEAMGTGLPVVASDIPPNRELVVHGETGYLVPVGDRVAFAQFAQKLLLDTELSARFGFAARERIRTEFSVAKMVEAYANLYREVAARSQRL